MRVLIGRDEVPQRRLTVRLLWEPRDVWVGVFWNRAKIPEGDYLLVYLCVLPCLPLSLAWRRR